MKNKTVLLFSVALMGFIVLFFLFRPSGEREVQEDTQQKAPESKFALGVEYLYGTETRKANPELAAYWFRKVSDEIPEAMYNYGFCLEHGLGVDRDPIAATECYRKAAEKKCQPAEFKYAMVLLNGIEFRTDEERSRFKEEDIPARDPEKARKKIEALADSGYLPAMVELAAILIADPRNVEKADAEKAFNLVFDAVKAPDAPSRAWRILGDCYFYGFGTASDGKKMIEALEKAASMGNMEALFRIGYCYEFGINVEADSKKALACYEHAAEAGLAGADEAIQRVVLSQNVFKNMKHPNIEIQARFRRTQARTGRVVADPEINPQKEKWHNKKKTLFSIKLPTFRTQLKQSSPKGTGHNTRSA